MASFSEKKKRRSSKEVNQIKKKIYELLGQEKIHGSGIRGLSQQEIVQKIPDVSYASIESCIRCMHKKKTDTPIHIGYYQVIRGKSKLRAVFMQGQEPDADPGVIENVIVVDECDLYPPDEAAQCFRTLQAAFFSIPPSSQDEWHTLS